MTAMSERSERSGELLRPIDLWQPIWSDEGWRCIATKRDEHWHHSWWRADEQAEASALEMDLVDGVWVYHGCGTYRQPGQRTQQNVLHLKCYWLDIDCGPSQLRPCGPFPTCGKMSRTSAS